MTMHVPRFRTLGGLLVLLAIVIPAALRAQKAPARPAPAPARATPRTLPPKAPLRAASTTAAATARGGAWSLPDADALVQRVYARIVAQDKPGAVPISDYQRRFVGRDATLEAVRRFVGHEVALAPSAFNAVDGWTDSPKLQLPLCEGPGCPAPINSIWLAITRIERGEAPHELHVWYTTSFAAESPTNGPTQQAYAFCERWLRVGGGWKYDGFVRVATATMGTD
jgi:hypothetical protein